MSLQPLQAGHSSLRQRKLESDAEIRCRKYHTLSKSPARVPSCVDDASCLGCLHGAGSTQVWQWRQKRVLMRPEAAFPYVFAAEGAQHPPKSRHAQRPATLNVLPRSTSCHAQRPATLNVPPRSTSCHAQRPATTAAAGGTILFCRDENLNRMRSIVVAGPPRLRQSQKKG